MKDETRNQHGDMLWALPASLILHAFAVALLVTFALPRSMPQQEEQPVSVTFVPPPEPESKPDPVSPPKAVKPPEPKAEQPPPPKKQPTKPAQIEILKPVFQFGDKDAGPKKSLGGSPEDGSPAPKQSATEDSQTQPHDAAKQVLSSNSDKDAVEEPTPNQATADRQADQQEASLSDAEKQSTDASAPSTDESEGEIALPTSAKLPQPRPSPQAKTGVAKLSKPGNGSTPNSAEVAAAPSERYSGLPGVRKLFSPGATFDARATTAISGMPRDKRVARLCASELQQQLVADAYSPNLVPLIPLKAGNVLDIPEAAFRDQATWYRLGFRCEVDPDATRVASFTFSVGAPIPRGQWAELGLPNGF